jgi:hypothetical protein
MVTSLGIHTLLVTVKGLLQRTWSSSSLSNSEKMRRLVACVNFADTVRLPNVASSILEDIYPRDLHNALQPTEMGRFLKSQGNGGGQKIGLCAQSIVAGIISNVESSNERWVALAADHLGESEDVIRGYLERGNDDVLLANLTHITREILHPLEDNREMAASLLFILPSLSNFDIRNTLPGLQNRFRALWDEIEQTPNDRFESQTVICRNLLNLYNASTQSTNSAASTPSATCTDLPGNPPASISPVHEEVAQTHTITSPPVSHHGASIAIPPPDLTTAAPAAELSLDGIPVATQRPTTAAAGSDPTPLGSHDCSGSLRAIAYSSTATIGNICTSNIQSGEQPTIHLDSSSILPTMVTSTSSSNTSVVASVFRPHIAGTAPFVAARDPNDPTEMESLHRTHQSETLAENRDPSDNPTGT